MIKVPTLQEYALRAVWASNGEKPLFDEMNLQENCCYLLLSRMYRDFPQSVYLKDSARQFFSLYERSLKQFREKQIIPLELAPFLAFRQRVIKVFSLHLCVPLREILRAEDPKVFLEKSIEMTDHFLPHIALALKTWLLSEAVIFGYWQAVSPLVDKGADVDYTFPQHEFKESPFPRNLLFHALLSQDIVMSYVLIKAGASVHLEIDLNGESAPKSPLDLARRLYPSEAITQFIEKIAKHAI